jgi:hypothetical protein
MGPVGHAQSRLPEDRTTLGGYGEEELAGYAYRALSGSGGLTGASRCSWHLELWIRCGGAKKRRSAFSLRVSISRIRDCSIRARGPISGNDVHSGRTGCDRREGGDRPLYSQFFIMLFPLIFGLAMACLSAS